MLEIKATLSIYCYLPCAKHHAKYFISIISHPMKYVQLLLFKFINEEIEAKEVKCCITQLSGY